MKNMSADKNMHIAILIGALVRGGTERVATNLADYFVNQGYRVTMVTQYEKENEYPLNPEVRRVISDITEEETTNNRLLNFKRRFCRMRNIWKKEKPDVILSFIGKNNMMAILTSRFLRIPVAVSVRADPYQEYYNSWMRFMARHLFARADGVILQTRQGFDFFSERVRKKAVILRNPVSAEFFRERYEGERDKTVVAVGRVDENKNHEMLIRAFAGIASEFPDYKLIIYGEGNCRQRLIRLVKELSLEKQIFLPGSIDHVSDVIYKASVFVLCSNTEGVPNTLVEAMIMGTAVISTDCPCGGPADLIDHQVNGILTPVGDVEMLQENLQNLLNNLQRIKDFGEKAKRTADMFLPEKVYGQWEDFIVSLRSNYKRQVKKRDLRRKM